MPKNGDPVINKKGQAIGWVTSAAVDVDGLILGLAYIQSRYHRPGEEIGIFNVRPSRSKKRATKRSWNRVTRSSCPTRLLC